ETSLALCEREGLADLLPGVCSALAHCLTYEPGSDLPRAAALLRQALDSREGLYPGREVQGRYEALTEIYARLGKWDELMAVVRANIAAGGALMGGKKLPPGLAALEERMEAQGRQAEFIAFCDDARRRLAQTGAADPLVQWYLAPAQPSARFSQV